MRLIRDGGLFCLQFPALAEQPAFFHGIFPKNVPNRRGSQGAFHLGLGRGAPDSDIWRNRRRMLNFFGSECVGVYANQVHGNGVGLPKPGDKTARNHTTGAIQLDGDALMTDQPEAALVIQVADCQPIILVDPVRRVVANIHSGWRGSIHNVIGVTVSRMTSEFSCRPEHLLCGIGPSLGPCCAEFINYKKEIPQSLWGYRRTGDLFDFWQMSMDQLTQAGVRANHISLARMCTRCNQHLFFSYRGEQSTGRFAAVIGIRGEKRRDHATTRSDG
jgi:YfiH family protein